MSCLTDALVETNPAHAFDLYLDFEAEVQEILELAMWSSNSAMTCYNDNTISTITDKQG